MPIDSADFNAEAQAFPSFQSNGETRLGTEGLTKREYMAVQICAGLCAGHFDGDAVESAIKIADRLLAKLGQ